MGNASSTKTAESDNIPNTDEWPTVPAVDPYAIPSAPGHDSSPSPSLSPSSSFSSLSDELQDENVIQAGTNTKATINLADAALSVVNTTAWMKAAEWKVDGHAIRPGDLLEFSMGRTFLPLSHFGVYLGNGLLVHVSSGRGLHSHHHSATAPGTATTRWTKHAASVRPRLHVMLGRTLLEESPERGTTDDGQHYIRIDHIVRVAGKGQFRVNNQTKLKENYEFEERTLQEILVWWRSMPIVRLRSAL
ncbi:uncharacterized protein LOC129599904 [Paramacrobiotus metropolitanus]|uniref:uncharacterized protein LOC129599904 n=1 Tax=Paramacrobiotus metropolitanus TaxID=2943436 RepID=UPI002445BDF4|nr:uncharacterized protein LOC129599904 [Paramacrobiotus metropolitanus]